MKLATSTLTYALAAIALTWTLPAGADAAPKRGAGKGRAAILKHFDKDGDGKLSQEERAAAKEAIKDRAPGKARRNGKLSETERAAAKEARQDRREKQAKRKAGNA